MIWKGRVSVTFLVGLALPAGERPWWVAPIGPWIEIKVTNAAFLFGLTLWLRWRPAFRVRRGWWLAELMPVRLEWCHMSRLAGIKR